MATSENRLQWSKKGHKGLWVALAIIVFGLLIVVATGVRNKMIEPKSDTTPPPATPEAQQRIVDTVTLEDQLQQLDFETKSLNSAINATDSINKETDQDSPQKEIDKATEQSDLATLYQSLITAAQESKKTISANLDLHPDEKQAYYAEQDRVIDFYTKEVSAVQKSATKKNLDGSRDRAKAFADDHVMQIKKIASTIWDQRIVALDKKYQTLGTTIDQSITALEAVSFDGKDLQAHRDAYAATLNDAATNNDKALAKVAAVVTMDDLGLAMSAARGLVDQSLRNLEEAQSVAKQIVILFENAHLKSVRVAGNGQVFAKGTGSVTFAGSGGATINNINGSVVVTDNTTPNATGVAITNISGTGDAQRRGNAVYYPQFTGSMKITGTDMKITVTGTLDLQAGGVGVVTIAGNGTWSVGEKRAEKAELLWPTQAFNIELK